MIKSSINLNNTGKIFFSGKRQLWGEGLPVYITGLDAFKI